jgi:AcrR family transcriptional regulator
MIETVRQWRKAETGQERGGRMPRKGKRAAERICESARELFYRDGIRAVAVEQIVAHAGVTRPSLYRAFASKDDLIARYVTEFGIEMLQRFDVTIEAYPGDPRAGVLAVIARTAARTTKTGSRGCGITNAIIEYPDPAHPVRVAADASKSALRQRLRDLSQALGARDPAVLGDGLLLLIEGCLASGQLFGPGGPAAAAPSIAAALIDAESGQRTD